jgi:hypothetical protein
MWRERSLKIGSREAAIGNGAAFRPNSVIRRATPAEFYKKGMSRKNFCLGRRASAWPQFPAHCVYVSAPRFPHGFCSAHALPQDTTGKFPNSASEPVESASSLIRLRACAYQSSLGARRLEARKVRVGVRSRARRDFGMPKTPKVSARQHMVRASCSLMRTTRTLGCFSLRMFVTRTPSMTGIERSRRTTSGDNSVTFRTASSPSTA